MLTLATVALDADAEAVRLTARTQARLLLANDNEVDAAADAVIRALAHPLFERVRTASAAGRCARECPILWRAPDGSIVEGTVDVVFEEGDDVIVMDFKTDREPAELKDQYRASADALLPRVLRAAKQARAGCSGQDLIEVSPALGSDSLLEETPRWRFRMHTRATRAS